MTGARLQPCHEIRRVASKGYMPRKIYLCKIPACTVQNSKHDFYNAANRPDAKPFRGPAYGRTEA